MVNILYAVTAFACALIVITLPARIYKYLDRKRVTDKALIRLIAWTVIFCMADGFWGVAASDVIMNDNFLFGISFIFHLFAAFTPLVWMQFVLIYLGNVRFRKLYIGVTTLIFLAELVLLIINIKAKFLFYVDVDGAYCSTTTRNLLFYAQYLTYVFIAVICIFRLVADKVKRYNNFAVLAFVAAPIACGVYQMYYPDAPAYSIGYTLGICIIFSFIVTEMLEARIKENVEERYLIDRLAEARKIADEANEAKTRFLFNMSHDIRTPMNAITGYTTMAKKYIDGNDKVKDCLDKIGKAGNNLLELVNQVLDMSRIESGKVVLAQEKADIIEQVYEMTAIIGQSADSKNITVNSNVQNIRHRNIIADKGRMNQLMLNILGNAVKYTPEGGTITFTAIEIESNDSDYGKYQFIVEDNGIGMSEEYIDQIYEPFSRENNTTVSKIEGSGLGMSIVKRLTDLMKGQITIDSQLGKGTKITITISFKIQDDAIRSADEGKIIDASHLKGKRLLLVEDNEMNREIAKTILEEYGIIVDEAEDGDIAVDILSKIAAKGDYNHYNLVLMDVQMPHMNGYEATKAIRNIKVPEGIHLPIIAMTANAFEEDRQDALRAGMDEHIAKPIDIQKLLAALTKFI